MEQRRWHARVRPSISVVVILGLFGLAPIVAVLGLMIDLAMTWDAGGTSPWWWIGLVVAAALVASSGPVAWWGFGYRRDLLYWVPLLVIPTWVVLWCVLAVVGAVIP